MRSPDRRKRPEVCPEADSSVRLLAVDDDRAYREYLRLVLTRAGLEVDLASSGAEVVEQLREDPRVTLLLLDFAMPDMDGIATARRIHDEMPQRTIYTMLLTAHDSVEVKLRALDSGFDDFLPKTSSESELVAKVRSALRRLEMERRLQAANRALETLAMTDELTGIANRRALFAAAETLLASGRSASVVLFDLDNFKTINDTEGHIAGDRVLVDVASCLKLNTRVDDVIGRYGGDEFVVVFPDTGEAEARRIAARIAACVSQIHWSDRAENSRVSATYGVATSGAEPTTFTRLLARCDAMLYRLKHRPTKDDASGAIPLPPPTPAT